MTKHSSQRIIIVGATSGIGREVALLLLKEGHQLGLAGRREEQLKELQKLAPDHIGIRSIDIRREEEFPHHGGEEDEDDKIVKLQRAA